MRESRIQKKKGRQNLAKKGHDKKCILQDESE